MKSPLFRPKLDAYSTGNTIGNTQIKHMLKMKNSEILSKCNENDINEESIVTSVNSDSKYVKLIVAGEKYYFFDEKENQIIGI